MGGGEDGRAAMRRGCLGAARGRAGHRGGPAPCAAGPLRSLAFAFPLATSAVRQPGSKGPTLRMAGSARWFSSGSLEDGTAGSELVRPEGGQGVGL